MKFVRKRKKETPPPVYLNLKDYPDVPTQEMYEEYYLFIRGWLDEIARCMENNYGKKRRVKAANEALENLKQIISFLNEEGREKIWPIYSDLQKLKEKVGSPYISYSQQNQIIRQAESIKRRFEVDFTYDKAKQWFKNH